MRRLRALTLCALLPCLQVAAQPTPEATPEATPAPKPTVSVSFTRQAIREDDSVQVQVWIANESDQDLTEVRLHVAPPSFIKWYAEACGGSANPPAQGGPLELGPVRAHAVGSRALCLRSDSNIDVGEFNLLFTFEYGWQAGGATRHSLVTVEKTLKASLLGSDDVAGIPVGLAGFIVPGLFFWLVVTLCKVPWLPWEPGEMALGDRLIYSVLISIFVVVVGSRFEFSDIGAGLGLLKLGYLAVGGAALGALVSGVDRLIRFLAARRQRRLDAEAAARQKQLDEAEAARLKQIADAAEARLIKLGDNADALLDKLLDTHPNASRPRAVVTLENGQSFRGSLARRDRDATGMVGWFQVVLGDQPSATADGFKGLVRARRWREALDLARRSNLVVEARDTIYETTGGADDPQEYWFQTWDSSEVKSVTNEDDAGDLELITPQ